MAVQYASESQRHNSLEALISRLKRQEKLHSMMMQARASADDEDEDEDDQHRTRSLEANIRLLKRQEKLHAENMQARASAEAAASERVHAVRHTALPEKVASFEAWANRATYTHKRASEVSPVLRSGGHRDVARQSGAGRAKHESRVVLHMSSEESEAVESRTAAARAWAEKISKVTEAGGDLEAALRRADGSMSGYKATRAGSVTWQDTPESHVAHVVTEDKGSDQQPTEQYHGHTLESASGSAMHGRELKVERHRLRLQEKARKEEEEVADAAKARAWAEV
jgi:hypothetical protein